MTEPTPDPQEPQFIKGERVVREVLVSTPCKKGADVRYVCVTVEVKREQDRQP